MTRKFPVMKLCRLSGHAFSESQTAPQSGSLVQSKPQHVMWGVRGILGVLQPLPALLYGPLCASCAQSQFSERQELGSIAHIDVVGNFTFCNKVKVWYRYIKPKQKPTLTSQFRENHYYNQLVFLCLAVFSMCISLFFL